MYQSLGLAGYCILVVFIMANISNLFPGSSDIMDLMQGFIFLTMFLVSALITGSIALAYPISLAYRKNIKEAAFVILSTVVWSIIFLLIALIVAIIIFKS